MTGGPVSFRRAGWLTRGDISAALAAATVGVINCRGYSRITITFTIRASGDPQGQLYIVGGGDEDNLHDLPLDEGKVLIKGSSNVTHSSSNPDLKMIDVNDPADDAHVSVTLVGLPPFLGIRYAYDSGSNAEGLDAGYTLEA